MTFAPLSAQAYPTPIRPFRFVACLIATPLVVALVGIVLMIPPIAAVIGGPLWIAIGAPVLIWAIRNGMTCTRDFAMLGLAGNVATPPVAGYAASLSGAGTDMTLGFALFTFAIGCVFAPLWAAVFAELYQPGKLQT